MSREGVGSWEMGVGEKHPSRGFVPPSGEMIRSPFPKMPPWRMNRIRSGTIRSHRDLEVWQTALELALETYLLTEQYPRREIYGLAAQMRRAAASIGSNIAEGHGRDTTRDFLRFLAIAAGSLRELDTYFVLSLRLEYVTKAQVERLGDLAESIGRMLTTLRAVLRRKIRPKPSQP